MSFVFKEPLLSGQLDGSCQMYRCVTNYQCSHNSERFQFPLSFLLSSVLASAGLAAWSSVDPVHSGESLGPRVTELHLDCVQVAPASHVNYFLPTLIYIICTCKWAWACHGTHMKIRG